MLRKIDHSFLPEQPNAAGSVWSTVNDMARWAQCLLSGGGGGGGGGLNQVGERVLSEGAVAALFEPQVMLSEDEYLSYGSPYGARLAQLCPWLVSARLSGPEN